MNSEKKGLITIASAVGEREYQEDFFLVEEDLAEGTLLAVMDGHIGTNAALFVRDHLVRYFRSGWIRFRDSDKAFRYALKLAERGTRKLEAGTTVSAVFIYRDKPLVLVSVVGDSPVVILTNDGPFIGPDHNVRTNPQERERCIARGARYKNGYIFSNISPDWGLQMSRSFGDRDMGDVIEHIPEFFSLQRADGGYIALMTDGVIDSGHASSESIKTTADFIHDGAEAADLVRRVLDIEGDYKDNATAIVWRPV